MEYLLISTAAASVVLFVAFFLRSTREALEDSPACGMCESEFGDFWNATGRSSGAVPAIFSTEDEQFISGEANRQVIALFRRERKRVALRWIERQKIEAARIMRQHREASRSAADLQPASELAFFLRHARLRLLCEFLAISVWLVGPQGLRGLAEEANGAFHGMQGVKALGRGD
jgi:hypothetical protein